MNKFKKGLTGIYKRKVDGGFAEAPEYYALGWNDAITLYEMENEIKKGDRFLNGKDINGKDIIETIYDI